MVAKLSAFAFLTLVYCLLSQPMTAFAQQTERPTAPPEPSKEMRAKMASLHERMAACLRSDKSFVECRSEMMKSCQELLGEHGCPMMGMRDQMMRESRPGNSMDK
jgi:hypothetical protein